MQDQGFEQTPCVKKYIITLTDQTQNFDKTDEKKSRRLTMKAAISRDLNIIETWGRAL